MRINYLFYINKISSSSSSLFSLLSIKSEQMDGFWCSRCLNDHIDVPNMIWSFSGAATTPLVVKSWTKQPWLKIRIFAQLWSWFHTIWRHNLTIHLLYTFKENCLMILHNKFQVILSKIEGVTANFVIHTNLNIPHW